MEFITCELFYAGKSYGHITWCPVCGKGFDTGPDHCPHCRTSVPEEHQKQGGSEKGID